MPGQSVPEQCNTAVVGWLVCCVSRVCRLCTGTSEHCWVDGAALRRAPTPMSLRKAGCVSSSHPTATAQQCLKHVYNHVQMRAWLLSCRVSALPSVELWLGANIPHAIVLWGSDARKFKCQVCLAPCHATKWQSTESQHVKYIKQNGAQATTRTSALTVRPLRSFTRRWSKPATSSTRYFTWFCAKPPLRAPHVEPTCLHGSPQHAAAPRNACRACIQQPGMAAAPRFAPGA